MQYKISASITDFPLQTSIETFFRKFKEAGVDSVEIVIGAKTTNIPHMFALSEKYQLPIVSFHQSPWSGFGFSCDETFIAQAKKHGVNTLTFHPLTFLSFDAEKMTQYFTNFAKLQKKYGMTFCLENMPNDPFYSKLHTSTMDKHLEKTCTIAQQYGFALTYDTSHTLFPQPQKEEVFHKIFPEIKNIHLSSFQGKKEHMALDTGEFKTKEFIVFLNEKKYKGLITFEINYSLFKRMLTPYDFVEIARSVKNIKSPKDSQ
jgi:sugar phosphate isomerase/epimerase